MLIVSCIVSTYFKWTLWFLRFVCFGRGSWADAYNSDYQNKGGSSTFYPTIYRGDYVGRSDLSDRFATLLAASRMLVERWTLENITGHDELKRKKLIQWSILQHYEVCDTPLIDFTHSLRVAASFAQLDAKSKYAYVYAFGLPYLTNRISNNSEHDLVNIRLLSICPPEALRPYYQEGYLAATEDIETEYDDKTELDFNNRLIAKFKIPTGREFWGRNFKSIPKNALYPKKDKIAVLSSSILESLDDVVTDSDIRQFLTVWAELEDYIVELTGKDGARQSLLRSLNFIKEKSMVHPRVLKDIDLSLIHI